LGKEEVSCAGRQDAARVGARGAAATGLLPRVCAGEVMQAAPRAGSAACLSPAEPAVPALCGLQAHAAVLARQHVIACVQSGGSLRSYQCWTTVKMDAQHLLAAVPVTVWLALLP